MTLRVPTDPPSSGFVAWSRKAGTAINQLISELAGYLPLTGGTLTGDLSVPDEAYGVGWNGSVEVPTKNALYDKIETIAGGGGTTTNALTITNTGGAAAGTTFDGSVARTIDYSTVGAAASSHSHAQSDLTGLTTADSPQFAGLNVGHASDTTITRNAAGDINVEGNLVYRAGGTDVPVTDGGTGASTAAGAATNLGVGTGDSPQFTAVNLGHASDTTIARSAAGVITVEGKTVFLDFGIFHLQGQQTSGTSGGGATASTFNKVPLNTTVTNTITSASVASSVISLPAGTYQVVGWTMAHKTAASKARLRDTTNGTTLLHGATNFVDTSATSGSGTFPIDGQFTLAGTVNIEFQLWAGATQATNGLGVAASSGENECFADVFIKRIA